MRAHSTTLLLSHKHPYISSLILCHLACDCYLCRDGCVKCSNVVECTLFVCVLCQPVPPTIPTFGRLLLEIFLNFLFLLFFVMQCRPRTCGLCVIRAHAPTKWRPTANTLCPHDRKALELCRSYAQNKVQKHHPQRIPWLLVALIMLKRYAD